MGSRATATAVN